MKLEKEQAKYMERQEGVATAAHWRTVNTMLTEQEISETQIKQQATLALVNDWRFQKNRNDRIEADLNPKLNQAEPINPETCGISAAQKFAGEDGSIKERSRIQATQMKSWCDEQLILKQEREEREKDQDREAVEITKVIDDMRLENEMGSEVQAKQALMDVYEENRLLAREKRLQKRQEELLEKQANQWEVENARGDTLLCETGDGRGPSGRLRRDHWKGMSQAEIDQIHAHNAQLAAEQRESKAWEKEEDMYWAQNNQEITASLAAQEADEETWRTSQRYELKDDHLHQRREHRLKQKFLKKELGEGAIGQGFYSQFGSNARCRHKSELLVKNMPPFT